jgi:hypothetical protein
MKIKTTELQKLFEALEEKKLSITDAITWAEDVTLPIKKDNQIEKNPKPTIVLTVNYSQNVEKMIANGNYNWQNSDITEKHFPLPAELIGKKVEISTKLYYCSKNISSKNAIAEMDKDGYRPATLAELLVLGETNPELQRQAPIIALGSVWQSASGSRYVPCLSVVDGRRGLRLSWFGGDWSASYSFLAVRK